MTYKTHMSYLTDIEEASHWNDASYWEEKTDTSATSVASSLAYLSRRSLPCRCNVERVVTPPSSPAPAGTGEAT